MKTLSIHLRVFNEEEFIRPTVECVVPFAQDVYITDTGSVDKTLEIAKELFDEHSNVRLEHEDIQDGLGPNKWTEDKRLRFIGILNEMKERTKTDWILKIDGDELFSSDLMWEIQDVIQSDKPPIYSIPHLHFLDWEHYYDPPKANHMSVARLYRNIPEISWYGRIDKNGHNQEYLGYKTRVGTTAISSKANQPHYCKLLENSFLHLGQLRKGKTKPYRYHKSKWGMRKAKWEGEWPEPIKPYVGK